MAKRRELKVYVQRRGGENRDAVVEQIVRDVVGKLFSTRMANTLRITVKLRSSKLSKGVGGCAAYAKAANTKSKHYTITLLRDLRLDRLAKIIAHELQHVHQFATKRLRIARKAGVMGFFWRTGSGPATFTAASVVAFGSDGYWTAPWEVEARASEKLGA